MWERVGESVFGSAVGQIVATLFFTLVVPPSGNMLPPGTSETVVTNYVYVVEHPPRAASRQRSSRAWWCLRLAAHWACQQRQKRART